MKKNLMKKVFAVSLSIAMACSLAPASNPVTASAAAPYVSLRTTFKTLKVGGINTMTLKNNSKTLNWKITKVATTDRTKVMVYNKTASNFRMKGKAVGRATVKARLKTTERKTKNSKLVSCRVKVVEADKPPVVETSKTVTTQAELTAALADKNLTSITISSTEATPFDIPAGDYKNVDLTINTPNADVTNAGVFKSVTIQAIKGDTFFEKAIGNAIRMLSKGRIVINDGAKPASIAVAPTAANAEVKIEVNGTGTVGKLTISTSVQLTLSGTSTAAIPVEVEAGAANSVITSAIPVNMTVKASVSIKLEKGAEGSTVNVAEKGITAKIDNQTNGSVEVTKADGSKQTVNAGTKYDAYTPSNSGGNNGGNSGGNNGGTSSGTTSTQAVSIDLNSDISASITSVEAIESTSKSAVTIELDFTKANATMKNNTSTSGSALQYLGASGTWKSAEGKVTETVNISDKATYSIRYRFVPSDSKLEVSSSRTKSWTVDIKNKKLTATN
ncbi:MAG: hypothetical protein HFH35_01425 [Eubacterium sp.]|nr:hypothetical protein [Eubacterium sp.]